MTETSSHCPLSVMPGHSASEDARRRAYDPGIHQKNVSSSGMDCRVKPGNDGGGVSANVREDERRERGKPRARWRKWQHGESND